MSEDMIQLVSKEEVHKGSGGEQVIDFPGWYFWDEACRHGPFSTRKEAADAAESR